jgi:hypothetical protein
MAEMDMKEKLVELLCKMISPTITVGEQADFLIANGVMVQEWISVTERLPENEIDVLICAERRLFGMAGGERKTIRVIATAFHTDGKMNTEDSGYNWELDNVDMKYDEEADAYIVPEGWWEAVRYGEEFSAVDDFVTHWMPLPEPPKEVE